MLGPARIKPWELGELTLTDIADLLDEDFETRRAPVGHGPPMDHNERLKALEEYRRLTPAQKLEQFQATRRLH